MYKRKERASLSVGDIILYKRKERASLSVGDIILYKRKERASLIALLVYLSLLFSVLISQIHIIFVEKKCEKLLHCKSFSHFFQQKYQRIDL